MARGENAIIPGAVAQRAAFDRREACRECSKQHGRGQPEGKLGSGFARIVGSGLCLGNDVVDAFLGIGLAYAGARSHDLRYIGFIGGTEVLIVVKAGRPQAQDFCPRLIAALRWLHRARTPAAPPH